MLVKTKAIVISTLKYQEKSLIVKCFTLSDGLKSYFVRNVYSSKKNNQKIAYFQPFTILNVEVNHKNKGSLEYINELKLAVAFQSVNVDIVKSTILMFLSEVLHYCIHEEEKNENLFSFIEISLCWLDSHDEVVNFHLIFLVELTKFLGFYPDKTDCDFPYFEMVNGVFSAYKGESCLDESESLLLKKLLNLKFDSEQKLFTFSERQILLKILLKYYSIHLDGFRKPKSLEVLREVFS